MTDWVALTLTDGPTFHLPRGGFAFEGGWVKALYVGRDGNMMRSRNPDRGSTIYFAGRTFHVVETEGEIKRLVGIVG